MHKIAFLFPGQGSQHVGMAKTLYDSFAIAKHTFEEANDILGFDLSSLCFQGSISELSRHQNMQPALLAAGVASYRVYMKETGITPQFCAGHSLGEYAALTCAGVLKFSDALMIMRKRALLAQEVADGSNGAMTILDGVDRNTVEEECRKVSSGGLNVSVSCYNSPVQFAISGHMEAVQLVEDRIIEFGGQITPLLDSPPFHSSLMQPAVDRYKLELEKYSYHYIRYPVISNVTGRPLSTPEDVAQMLALQLTQPVQWQATMEYMRKKGVTLMVELGPKNVLSSLAKANIADMDAFSYGQKEDKSALQEFISSDLQMTRMMPNVITKCLAVSVSTPNNNPDDSEYQEGVILPLKKIQEIQDRLERESKQPTIENMREALDMLRVILNAKKLSAEEQADWYNQILDEAGTRYLFDDFEKAVSL